MFTQKDVDILKNALPSKGITKIHKKTKISRPTIYGFFHGEKIRSELEVKIYKAGLKIIEQEKVSLRKIKEELSRILKDTNE